MTDSVAICPRDGHDLSSDFRVPGYEWHCPECGGLFEFFGVARRPA